MIPPLTVTVDGVPVAQPRHKVGAGFGGGKPRAYLPKDHPVHAFKQQAKLECRRTILANKQEWPSVLPLGLWLVFIMPRPQRLVWKNKPMPRCWAPHKPDCDNLVKAILDGIASEIVHDDAQIVWLNAWKYYAAGDEKPHVEVTVSILEILL